MQKIINPGSYEIDGQNAPIFCKIKIKGGKLSISGVIGPTNNGNSRGGCGQIDMEFEHRNERDNDERYSDLIKASDITFTPGWNSEIWFDFLDTWKQYHLNDMRASCEHQRAQGWDEMAREKVTIHTWRLMGATISKQKEIEEKAIASLIADRTASVDYEEARVLGLPYSIETYADEDHAYKGEGYYTRDKKEEKTRGWISFKDSARFGILSKPCEVCGYEYGSAWKKEELPAVVETFLSALPETTKTPAWV